MFADEGQLELPETIASILVEHATVTVVNDNDDDSISLSTIALVIIITGGLLFGFWSGKLPCLSKDAMPKSMTNAFASVSLPKFSVVVCCAGKAEPAQQTHQVEPGPSSKPSLPTPKPDHPGTVANKPFRQSQRSLAVKRTELTDGGTGITSLKAPPRVSQRTTTPPRKAAAGGITPPRRAQPLGGIDLEQTVLGA
jgi:hypothetical protein